MDSDRRLMVLIGIVILVLVAVYINRKYYGKKPEEQPTTIQKLPSSPTPPRKPVFVSFPKQHAIVMRQREFLSTKTTYHSKDRTFIMAHDPLPIPSKENPGKIAGMRPGRLFDVTKRLPGVEPFMLHRRPGPFRENTTLWIDELPVLGLNDTKMVLKPAADVSYTELSDADRVVGITLGEASRAYPVKMMNYHEVINDTINDVPVVIAWSALAEAAGAMDRRLPDREEPLRFGSAGLMYQGAIVLYDLDTMSLWHPVNRICIAGELAEIKAAPIQTFITTWKEWKRLHPATTALVAIDPPLPADYEKNVAYPRDGYLTDSAVYFPVYFYSIENSPMKPKVFVIGVTGSDGKSAKAYRVDYLKETSEPFTDTIGTEKVSLAYDASAELLTAGNEDGTPLLAEHMLWLYWAGAHPETEVWQKERMEFPYAQESETAPESSETPDASNEGRADSDSTTD